MLVINVNCFDIIVGFVALTFFFRQLKKKGDEQHKLPVLDSIFKIVLVIGKNNNVSLKKKTNIKK